MNLVRMERAIDSPLSKNADPVRSNLFWLDDDQWKQIERHLPTETMSWYETSSSQSASSLLSFGGFNESRL